MKGARIYRKRLTGWIVLSLFTIHSSLLPALEVSHTAMDGSDSVPAEYFRKWYHRSDLIYYLEALNDHTIVETPATGQWWQPDRLNIAIAGLPCTMSSYTIDGLRVDDRFAPGHSVLGRQRRACCRYGSRGEHHTPNRHAECRNIQAYQRSPPFARSRKHGRSIYFPRP